MAKTVFQGDKKAPMHSPLAQLEKRFIDSNWKKFPDWIEGYHLTLLTLIWSIGLVLFGYLAHYSLHWLWLSSIMLILQWFTDSFDGALGRNRDFGIPKWGYFMDHFLDYIFMGCLVIGYYFIADSTTQTWLLFFLLFFSALWVNAFLEFSVSNSFKITQLGMGPTEIRILFIIFNTIIIFKGPEVLSNTLPWATALVLVLLSLIVYKTQKVIWDQEMREKRLRKSK